MMMAFYEEIVYPFNSPKFKEWWQLWKDYKKEQHKFKFKSSKSEQAALMTFKDMSEDEAIEAMRFSMGNGWKGIFKNPNYGKQTSKTGTADAISILAERHNIR